MRHIVGVLALLVAVLCVGALAFSSIGPAEMPAMVNHLLLSAEDKPPVAGDEPPAVTETVTDRAGVLGGRTQEVQDAIAKLENEHGVRLYAVYVDDFAGRNATTWADDTAQRSGLGRDDVLMAVATTERRYALSADTNFRLSDAQLNQVARTSIVPALRQGDWAGAATGAATGIGDAIASTSGPGATSSGGGKGFLIALLVLLAAGVVGFLLLRRRRKARESAGLEALETKAGQALVQTDDAVKTSEQEIGFAQAQFGDEAAKPFTEALEYARGELGQAFRLRQRLDDEIPEDDETRKRMLEEIVQRCEAAGTRLDAESDAFDRLRDLESQAPQVLGEVRQAYEELTPKLAEVRAVLDDAAARYAPSALAPVEAGPTEAAGRLAFASEHLGKAAAAIEAGDNSKAVVPLLAAQSAVGQARQLLEAVTRRSEELGEAAAGLKPALEHVAANLSAAKAMAADERFTTDLSSQIAFAESTATQVATDVAAGPVDPIAQLRRVEEAQRALDGALSGVRDRQAREQQARGLLDQALLAARSEIGAAGDFITTNRGAVGSTARTRLAEARRLLDQAAAQAGADPVNALAAAQGADTLAVEAVRHARDDIDSSGLALRGGAGAGGGGGGAGAAMGAVLGGILIESMMGGASGRRRTRGRTAGPAPGSFGGARTRGRRGAGGGF
ncbi:TPM domain-containing protein [Nonomuraea sp. NPDC046570]|uniref:TPM domain-containing protein n=1 Tax=Nonomuraea sp. NPDC046570 TaxID=3155255 RepID=UPI0034049346